MGNVDFVELNLLDSGGIIALWNLSLIEEELGIQTFLISLPVSILKTVLAGVGLGWTLG